MSRRHRKFVRRAHLSAALLIALALLFESGAAQSASAEADSSRPVAAIPVPPLPPGSWRFIVSGDSRNCGDIVMPAIAAHSAQFTPAFYWHLGDLRAIYKIDEDMAVAAKHSGQVLTCESYQRLAWPDFLEHQVAPFGDLPFYLGIGNHEVMTPKNEDAFRRQFFDWMNLPALRRQRALDREPSRSEPYFHWIQGGVDFIYLDNAEGFFSEEQLTWFFRRLSDAKYSPAVKSLVVGMHEALPDSISNDHSMGDGADPRGRSTGEMVYNALLAFNTKKPVYVLASHSHVYLENIFNVGKLTQNGAKPLSGWIAGTAGAVRYPRPRVAPPMGDVYGYLLATVDANGKMDFAFEEVTKSDVPESVKQRYPDMFVPWCFTHNSQNVDKPAPEQTCEK